MYALRLTSRRDIRISETWYAIAKKRHVSRMHVSGVIMQTAE